MTPGRRLPRWLAPGDWNAFFGLALDNTTQLVILSGLLIGVFKFPADLVLGRMVPGTAAGVEARYFELDSDLGHSSSGAEHAKWSPVLREFLAPLVARLN